MTDGWTTHPSTRTTKYLSFPKAATGGHTTRHNASTSKAPTTVCHMHRIKAMSHMLIFHLPIFTMCIL